MDAFWAIYILLLTFGAVALLRASWPDDKDDD